jgi:hypothetical protein
MKGRIKKVTKIDRQEQRGRNREGTRERIKKGTKKDGNRKEGTEMEQERGQI